MKKALQLVADKKSVAKAVCAMIALLIATGVAVAGEGAGATQAAEASIGLGEAIAKGSRVLAAGLAIGLAAGGGGIGMGILGGYLFSATARNPETRNVNMTAFWITIAFIEALSIYALLIAIILMFVIK